MLFASVIYTNVYKYMLSLILLTELERLVTFLGL